MPSAKLTVTSEHSGDIVLSLGPEANRELPRTHVTVHGNNGSAVVTIEASDTSAMRAALNSYLECIRITEDIGRITR